MRSSLSYAILAMLAGKPQTGYDIARQMRPPLGFVWQAYHGQIYPELSRLVKARLIRYEQQDGGAGPPRKVHSVTAAGRAELQRWIARDPQDRPPNDELVIKAYALKGSARAAWLKMLRSQMDNREARLAALEHQAAAIEVRSQTRGLRSAGRFGEYAALRRAIGSEREYLAWCKWLLAQVAPQNAARLHRPRTAASSR